MLLMTNFVTLLLFSKWDMPLCQDEVGNCATFWGMFDHREDEFHSSFNIRVFTAKYN